MTPLYKMDKKTRLALRDLERKNDQKLKQLVLAQTKFKVTGGVGVPKDKAVSEKDVLEDFVVLLNS